MDNINISDRESAIYIWITEHSLRMCFIYDLNVYKNTNINTNTNASSHKNSHTHTDAHKEARLKITSYIFNSKNSVYFLALMSVHKSSIKLFKLNGKSFVLYNWMVLNRYSMFNRIVYYCSRFLNLTMKAVQIWKFDF